MVVMDVTKPYNFIGFGAMDVTKPYDFIGFGAMDASLRGPRSRRCLRPLQIGRSTLCVLWRPIDGQTYRPVKGPIGPIGGGVKMYKNCCF